MGKFTAEQVEYLNSLPAVAHASEHAIRYSMAFREEAMRRYRDGESPSAIFKAAGMPVSLVGGKRVERAFARWRADMGVPARRGLRA